MAYTSPAGSCAALAKLMFAHGREWIAAVLVDGLMMM